MSRPFPSIHLEIDQVMCYVFFGDAGRKIGRDDVFIHMLDHINSRAAFVGRQQFRAWLTCGSVTALSDLRR